MVFLRWKGTYCHVLIHCFSNSNGIRIIFEGKCLFKFGLPGTVPRSFHLQNLQLSKVNLQLNKAIVDPGTIGVRPKLGEHCWLSGRHCPRVEAGKPLMNPLGKTVGPKICSGPGNRKLTFDSTSPQASLVPLSLHSNLGAPWSLKGRKCEEMRSKQITPSFLESRSWMCCTEKYLTRPSLFFNQPTNPPR